MWSEIELAYLAGILDGEGTITINNRRFVKKTGAAQSHRVVMQIGNTDFRLMLWLKEHFGGYIGTHRYKNPNHKTLYRWTVETNKINSILAAVSPFLVLKKEQAFYAMEMRKTVSPFTGYKVPENVVKLRDSLREKVALLNKRGGL